MRDLERDEIGYCVDEREREREREREMNVDVQVCVTNFTQKKSTCNNDFNKTQFPKNINALMRGSCNSPLFLQEE